VNGLVHPPLIRPGWMNRAIFFVYLRSRRSFVLNFVPSIASKSAP
jgi:hypothetical protein